MRRRLAMGRKEVVTLFLPVLALVICETKGSVFDTPYEDLEQEDYMEYGQEVSIATAGLGIGLSIAFGFVAFIAMLAMCCRCKRLHRADLAIAQAEGDNDGKGLDDMYEIEDYEDHISKHRKILWLFSFVIFLGYLFCAGYAYNGAETTDESFKNVFDGTDVFLTKVQTALCEENGGEDCATGSVGNFVLGFAAALVASLDGVVSFIDGLGSIAQPLAGVSSSLNIATGVINTTERAVIHINDSITNVNLVLTGDGNVAEFTDGGAVPTIGPEILDDIQEGRDALAAASEMTEDSQVEVTNQLAGNDSEIVRTKYRLDDIHGNEIEDDEDERKAFLDTIDDRLMQPMLDVTVDIYDLQHGPVVDARDGVDDYLDMAVKAVAGLIFLPGAVLFLTSLCSCCCQSSKPLYLNMFFVFMTQILFCLVAGVFLAISKLNADVCDNHLSLLEANFEPYNATVQGIEIIVDFPKLERVLTCDGQPYDDVTPTNNFVDILEAQQVFNISEDLKAASSIITDNTPMLLEPKETIIDAQGELEPLNDFVDQDFVGDVNIDESAAEIDELLEDLPPTPFDWDDREHQDSLDNYFLKNVSEYSWNNQTTGEATYRGNLEDINAIIARMVDDVIGAGAFADIKDPYNFQQARNLTNETICASDSPFQPSSSDELRSATEPYQIYTYAGQYEQLCYNVTAYYETTKKLEELIEENGETRLELEDVRYEMGLIDSNITTITEEQAQMGVLRDEMNATLASLADTLDTLVDDLDGLAADLLGLNDILLQAGNFTKCGYIGDFYEDVYLDAMCTGLQANIEAVAGPALVVVILMFLSFCIQGCYGPSMRKRPRGTAGDFEGGKTHLNESGGQQYNLPTPHSPTPLVGNSGF